MKTEKHKAQSEIPMRFNPANGLLGVQPTNAADFRHLNNPKLAWLYNPWTGSRRDAIDVGEDPRGMEIFVSTNPNSIEIEAQIKSMRDVLDNAVARNGEPAEDKTTTEGINGLGDMTLPDHETYGPVGICTTTTGIKQDCDVQEILERAGAKAQKQTARIQPVIDDLRNIVAELSDDAAKLILLSEVARALDSYSKAQTTKAQACDCIVGAVSDYENATGGIKKQ